MNYCSQFPIHWNIYVERQWILITVQMFVNSTLYHYLREYSSTEGKL